MPTEKPRITFALDEDVLERLNEYKFQNRFKNQSQAILSLMDIALKKVGTDDLEQYEDLSARAAASPAVLREKVDQLKERVSHPVSDSADATSPDPLFNLLCKYEQLDEHGRRLINAVLEIELERCAKQ